MEKELNKIYLAGSCSSESRTLMQAIAAQLRNAGFEVYCPFEFKVPNAWDMPQDQWAEKVFKADVKALDNCDIFLLISPGRHSTAGSNWEQGYAYANKKRIIVVQYTNDKTSLMTYCGASIFINCTEKDLLENAVQTVFQLDPELKTILT